MRNRVEVIDWKVHGDRVRLTYSDGDLVDVSKTDFDRAFGAIMGADKQDVIDGFQFKELRRMEQKDLEKLALYTLVIELSKELPFTRGEPVDPLVVWSFMYLSRFCDALADDYAPDNGQLLLDDFKASFGGDM